MMTDGQPRRLRRVIGAVTAVVLSLALAACSALSGSDPENVAPGGPELSQLTVSANLSVTSGALYVAQEEGLFGREGLDVTIQKSTGGASALQGLLGGAYQIVSSNDSSIFTAQANHVTDLRIVEGGISAKPGNFRVLSRDQRIRGLQDLRGKRVGLSSKADTIYYSLVGSLAIFDITPDQVEWETVAFADGPAALESGRVDAMVLTAPYDIQAEADHARPVFDVFAEGSSTDNLPISSYVTTQEFAQRYPRTVAAFQRAMARGAVDADSNDRLTRAAVLKQVGSSISKAEMDLITLPHYQPHETALQLGRVLDLMARNGGLGKVPGASTQDTAARTAALSRFLAPMLLPMPAG
jgi:NitT/TauT family transport system substrate-binding protein